MSEHHGGRDGSEVSAHVRLRALAPAKVNLALFVGGRREDGRHRLVTAYESLSLADTLELETLDAGSRDVVICPGVKGENLAARALSALRARGWDGPPVRITIHKQIPIAAGMAGGSADGAAALRLAVALVPGRVEELDGIAAELGADVPAQLAPGLSLGTGAGELVERFEPLREHAFVVLPADAALHTPKVFALADELRAPRRTEELDALYLKLVRALRAGGRLPSRLIANDLEDAAVSLCPSCADALAALRQAGAKHALVSGSGPTVVGLWWGPGAAARAQAACTRLRERWPLALVAVPVDARVGAATRI